MLSAKWWQFCFSAARIHPSFRRDIGLAPGWIRIIRSPIIKRFGIIMPNISWSRILVLWHTISNLDVTCFIHSTAYLFTDISRLLRNKGFVSCKMSSVQRYESITNTPVNPFLVDTIFHVSMDLHGTFTSEDSKHWWACITDWDLFGRIKRHQSF